MSLHENISSLYDDELDSKDRDQVFASLKQDEEQQKTWGRYCIIGDAMRRNLPEDPNHNLFSRVQQALEDEPPLLSPAPAVAEEVDSAPVNVVELPTKPSNDSFFKPVAGFAVAASVALASVLGFQMFSQPVDDFQKPVVATVIPSPGTQELNISPVVDATTSVASYAASGNGDPTSEFDDVIYAEQSVMDDGQWTRITRIGNILLDNNIITTPPEASLNVDLQTGVVPFARASNLESVKPE